MDYINKTVPVEMPHPLVALVTINNPPLNLMTIQICEELEDTLDKLAADDRVRAVVLTGAGKHSFGCGSDIRQLSEYGGDIIDLKLHRENQNNNRIEYMPKPVIAAIEGNICGGAAEMCLACDLRVMSHTARYSLPEIKLGVFPGSGALFRLPKLIGPSRCKELMWFGDFIYAPQCLEWGIANYLAPPGEAVSVALELAKRLAAGPFEAVKMIKESVREFEAKDSDACYERNIQYNRDIYKTPDSKEGMEAFLAKRAPEFM